MTPAHPLLVPGTVPLRSALRTVDLERSDWEAMVRGSEALFELASAGWESWKSGDHGVTEFVEFGIPSELIDLQHRGSTPPIAVGLRFDFYLSEAGPRLIEVATNPWGLLGYEDLCREQVDAERLPALELYAHLLHARAGDVSVWPDWNAHDELLRLESLARRLGVQISRTPTAGDGPVFIDLDTAWFGRTLPLARQLSADRLVPAVANELLKHKTFLALAWEYARGALEGHGLRGDQHALREVLVPTARIASGDEPLLRLPCAVKDVIGMWGRQVTVVRDTTDSAAMRRLRRHLSRALAHRNAVVQAYVPPRPVSPGHHAEVSAVRGLRGWHPFARVYADGERRMDGPHVGIAPVRLVDSHHSNQAMVVKP